MARTGPVGDGPAERGGQPPGIHQGTVVDSGGVFVHRLQELGIDHMRRVLPLVLGGELMHQQPDERGDERCGRGDDQGGLGAESHGGQGTSL
ncbi:hypothetical protein RB199_29775 [Streptomyces libani]